MIFSETPLAGAWVIETETHSDIRGLFARTMCAQEFAVHGLNANFVQQSVSWNPTQGTLRGLHYQSTPHGENKLVRVTQGAIFDVIADLRKDSPSYGCWFSVELSADNRRQIYIPKGLAHGFISLLPNTEVFYQMTEPYHPGAASGICWNDPSLTINWPIQPALIDSRDQAWPPLTI